MASEDDTLTFNLTTSTPPKSDPPIQNVDSMPDSHSKHIIDIIGNNEPVELIEDDIGHDEVQNQDLIEAYDDDLDDMDYYRQDKINLRMKEGQEGEGD
jgi:hypothetical protein